MEIKSITLGVTEAAKMLHIHPETLKTEIRAGAIPAAKVGRAYVLLTEDVQAYLRAIVAKQTGERRGIRKPRIIKPVR